MKENQELFGYCDHEHWRLGLDANEAQGHRFGITEVVALWSLTGVYFY
ncbi:hypothetical protein SAMN04487912_105334 [Arthrobacter sp. cf158]|nr:hypothetical protein SAMN04487912_105334 [Arthrobacter sp. cf158]